MIEENILKGNLFCLANVDAKKVLDSLEDEESVPNESRKRKRLDDFTPQEKIIRRKLKNRVAAQTARDRKKERLEHLEHVVTRLEKENDDLKRSNEELRLSMNQLMEENKQMRKEFGLDTKKQKRNTQIIVTPTVLDHDHIVIKKEEDTEPEYASLGISLPQKVQILLVTLITMWLTNPRLVNCLSSLNNLEQEILVKSLLQKKLRGKKQSKTRACLIERLMRTNLIPLIQTCLQRRLVNCFHSVKTSKSLWMDPTIL